MAVNGNASIFRLNVAGETEATVASPNSNLIQFDGTSLVPDQLSHLGTWEAHMIAAIQENPRPQSNNPHDLQDNGLAISDVTVTMFFEDPANAVGPALLRNWMREAKVTNGSTSAFPFGKFGIRNNDFPIFNVTPTAVAGYILADVQWFRPTDQRYKVGAVAVFRFNGDITRLGV